MCGVDGKQQTDLKLLMPNVDTAVSSEVAACGGGSLGFFLGASYFCTVDHTWKCCIYVDLGNSSPRVADERRISVLFHVASERNKSRLHSSARRKRGETEWDILYCTHEYEYMLQVFFYDILKKRFIRNSSGLLPLFLYFPFSVSLVMARPGAEAHASHAGMY